MPVDVPALAKVNCCHFFKIDLMHSQSFVAISNVVVQLEHGSEVHKVASINSDISSKLLVGAWLPTTLFTAILDVIDHQASIVDHFSHSARKVNVFVGFEIFQIVSAEAASHYKTKDGAPLLTAAIKQVIGWVVKGLNRGKV